MGRVRRVQQLDQLVQRELPEPEHAERARGAAASARPAPRTRRRAAGAAPPARRGRAATPPPARCPAAVSTALSAASTAPRSTPRRSAALPLTATDGSGRPDGRGQRESTPRVREQVDLDAVQLAADRAVGRATPAARHLLGRPHRHRQIGQPGPGVARRRRARRRWPAPRYPDSSSVQRLGDPGQPGVQRATRPGVRGELVGLHPEPGRPVGVPAAAGHARRGQRVRRQQRGHRLADADHPLGLGRGQRLAAWPARRPARSAAAPALRAARPALRVTSPAVVAAAAATPFSVAPEAFRRPIRSA